MSGLVTPQPRFGLRWFANHEARLIWRDFASLVTGGKPGRMAVVGLIIVCFIAGMHVFAAYLLGPVVAEGLVAGKSLYLTISAALLMLFSLMFSQAIESVTRAYYTRSDLDLILSSPAPSHRLFEVRTVVLAFQTVMLSAFIAAPVINTLAWLDGAHWFAAYGVLAALGVIATSLSILLTLGLFRWVGMAKTRLTAQIMAAVVGAGFVIALQLIGIMFGQGTSRLSLLLSPETLAAAPKEASGLWMFAKAALGGVWEWIALVAASVLTLVLVARFSARRFAQDALAAAGVSEHSGKAQEFKGFRVSGSVRAGLRRKEWALLRRDPWLLSQSLQQILYLVPPAVMLWFSYGEGGMFYVVVPVVVMATGQLAGGLAWITISGEDAHELITTAPVPPRTILWAKVEAVLVVIALVVAPFALAMLFFSAQIAVTLIIGAALASGSAVVVQLWFRSQANRSLFRRRQVSSRAATLCEALVSILWAAAAGVALLNPLFAIVPALLVMIVFLVAWFIRPAREG